MGILTLTRRSASLGGLRVWLEYNADDPSMSQIADMVFPAGSDDTAATTAASFTLESHNGGRRLIARRDGAPLYEGDSAGCAASVLLDEVTRALVTDCREGPVFHAALLALGGLGVIVPGASGAGKTTLAAWLATRGFSCVNDEAALVTLDDAAVQSFARPLVFKGGDWKRIRHLAGIRCREGRTLETPVSTLVSPKVLGDGHQRRPLTLAAIVSPRREPDRVCTWVQLSRAETALALMGTLVNAANLPQRGFRGVSRLAQRVRGYELLYSDVSHITGEALVTWITSVCRHARVQTVPPPP